MNKVELMGRLTRDPDIRYTQGENPLCVARYTLAVDRKYKKRDEGQTADFIGCVAFGRAGEFAEKYLRKGMKIAITGRIQTGSYTDQDGKKVYTTDIVIEEHFFCESKNAQANSGDSYDSYGSGNADGNQPQAQVNSDGFMNIPDGFDSGLPFD